MHCCRLELRLGNGQLHLSERHLEHGLDLELVGLLGVGVGVQFVSFVSVVQLFVFVVQFVVLRRFVDGGDVGGLLEQQRIVEQFLQFEQLILLVVEQLLQLFILLVIEQQLFQLLRFIILLVVEQQLVE